MSAPLEGILVVALENAVSAPFTTRHLADLGARVLKVERPPHGDFARHYDSRLAGESTYFVWGNRGKDSVLLDLADPPDRERFDQLVAGADVFVQNLSPGAARRAGVLAEQLSARHRSLVACDISGYGTEGPRADDKAYDLIIQAEAGAVALTGDPDRISKVGFSVADICAGMYALSAILAALHRRAVTGRGAAISLSMLECLAEWTAPQTYASVADGAPLERSARRHTLIAPYGLFELADGTVIMLAVQSNAEWAILAGEVMGRPELATDARFATNAERVVNVEALEAEIASALKAEGAPATLQRLRRARIAFGRVHGPLELAAHEQLRALGRFAEVDLPGGRTSVLRPPFNISEAGEPRARVPALGEHDPALVAELIERGRRRADDSPAGPAPPTGHGEGS
ncbi:MAG: CaiB/BaiF CoA-transferase family protein [bacterium]|nr:CaiB/BaiF CoA-transferase family protein [bacterium]MXZ31072.1 CoA transferase [Acidimicrobiia bacterium]MDE0668220.1 CaiB/BaiF CoA-transferase family protein [bacterium]MYB25466.1 CoA transferase [Acidimicrobiia bacterium]MYE67902.1 CoA transferase [Acidimicrobiia bacterium]